MQRQIRLTVKPLRISIRYDKIGTKYSRNILKKLAQFWNTKKMEHWKPLIYIGFRDSHYSESCENHFNECKTFFIRIHNPYNPPFYKFEITFIIGIIIETYTTITNVATKP